MKQLDDMHIGCNAWQGQVLYHSFNSSAFARARKLCTTTCFFRLYKQLQAVFVVNFLICPFSEHPTLLANLSIGAIIVGSSLSVRFLL
jgi:hypothetical protein